MDSQKETTATIRGRLSVLKKGLLSEANSVEYYRTLVANTPEDTEDNIGIRRMYGDLMLEEQKHVQRFKEMITYWEKQLETLGG